MILVMFVVVVHTQFLQEQMVERKQRGVKTMETWLKTIICVLLGDVHNNHMDCLLVLSDIPHIHSLCSYHVCFLVNPSVIGG